MKNIAIALSVAATLFASAAVSAQETTEYSGYTGFVSTQTRAEVQAAARQALQNGDIVGGEAYPGPVAAAAGPGKTRAEVKAATLLALQRGEIRSGEQYPDFSNDVAPVEGKTRAEVKAELIAHRQGAARGI